MSRVPLQALQGFVAAARAKNLSRAAERMNLTVSALSHQMRGLEDRVGRKLFERGPRGLSLTAYGQQLFDQVGPAFDTVEHALRKLKASGDEQLTISAMPRIAGGWLVPRLPRFVALHPEVELNIQSSAQLIDFEREPIDAALRFGRGEWPGLRADPLFDEWIAPVASAGFVAAHGVDICDTLPDVPLLGAPSDRWQAWFKTFGGTPPKRYVATFSDSEALLKAAAEGLGVALAPLTLARPLLDAGKLVLLTANCMRADFSHWLVYPPRSEEHAGLRAFREWLLAEARAYGAADTRVCASESAP
ncbi:MAG TPA: LysR substrate-binding domain-containing protein [Candidatus Saccharimonadia bacterium]|nr:LysR substrate-binding domain-containing protein [Candidatus Saccharimonadia bacterium]